MTKDHRPAFVAVRAARGLGRDRKPHSPQPLAPRRFQGKFNLAEGDPVLERERIGRHVLGRKARV